MATQRFRSLLAHRVQRVTRAALLGRAARAAMMRAEEQCHGLPCLTDPEAAVRYFDCAHCIAWHGNIQLILSRQPPSLPAMRKMIDLAVDLSARYGDGMGCLLVIHGEVSLPDEPIRAFIETELRRAPWLAAAQVVLAAGFKGAAMRSMLSVLQLAIRPRFSMRIFGDVSGGVDWLARTLASQGAEPPAPTAVMRTAHELITQFFGAFAFGD